MKTSSTLRKCTLLLLFAFLLNSTAHADLVWPSVYIAVGMKSIPVILAGLVVEILFVKYCTKIKWLEAVAVAFLMNLVTSVIGLYTNALSGFILDLILYYGIGYHSRFWPFPEFGLDHWILHYIAVIFTNILIEGGVVKLTLKLKLKNTFWWLFLANTISVMLCAVYIHFVPVRL